MIRQELEFELQCLQEIHISAQQLIQPLSQEAQLRMRHHKEVRRSLLDLTSRGTGGEQSWPNERKNYNFGAKSEWSAKSLVPTLDQHLGDAASLDRP